MIGLDEIPGLHPDVVAAGRACGGAEVIEKVRQLEADGGTSIEWRAASDWTVVRGTPSTPPSALDDVVIGGAAITNQPSITSTTGAVTIKSLTFEVGNGVALTLVAGGTGSLTTTSGLNWPNSVAQADVMNVNDRTLTVQGVSGNTFEGLIINNSNGVTLSGNGADNENRCRDRQLGNGHHADSILAILDVSVKLFPALVTKNNSWGLLGCLIF